MFGIFYPIFSYSLYDFLSLILHPSLCLSLCEFMWLGCFLFSSFPSIFSLIPGFVLGGGKVVYFVVFIFLSVLSLNTYLYGEFHHKYFFLFILFFFFSFPFFVFIHLFSFFRFIQTFEVRRGNVVSLKGVFYAFYWFWYRFVGRLHPLKYIYS